VKSLFYFISIALLFGACSYKNEVLNLDSYKPDYAGEVSKEHKSVYIKLVDDRREDKRSIGFIMKNGINSDTLFSNADFATKYKEGFLIALNSAGFNTQTSINDANLAIEIHIKKIEIIYNNKSFDENVKGTIEVEVAINNGGKETKQIFKQNAGKWISPSFNSKDLEPFLQMLFSDSVDAIVSKLTTF
jgi:uncharacterized lipoprotein